MVGKRGETKMKQLKSTGKCTIIVKLAGRGGVGGAWDGDLTFFKNFPSNSLPMGKSFQSQFIHSFIALFYFEL